MISPAQFKELRSCGASARHVGASLHDNPMYGASAPLTKVEELLDWHDACLAWAGGWWEADAGRSKDLHALTYLSAW